jgi:hypothetical protein
LNLIATTAVNYSSSGLFERTKMDKISGERRKSVRYALQLRLRYRVLDGDRVLWTGTSVTEDLSRGGIRFLVEHDVPVNVRLEITVDWPVAFGGIYPMELDLTGTIVRHRPHEIVARVANWSFRVVEGAAEGAEPAGRAYGWGPRHPRGEERALRAVTM